MERLQNEAEALGARGVVGVTVRAQEHAWRRWWRRDDPTRFAGELIEFFVLGTAVVPLEGATRVRAPALVIRADAPVVAGQGRSGQGREP